MTLDAALYGRTSTQIQQSCDVQLALARKLADDRGWRTTFQLKDEAFKGHELERPGYQRVLELVETERVQVVVVWKLDRLFRSLKEASSAQEMFTSHNVAIVSYTEPFDTTTSIGRFVFGFLANVAQFETDLIRDRAQLGYERRTREGKWTGAHVPFGYKRDSSGKLAVKSSEASVVLAMHAHYKRCKGDLELAKWLNARETLHRGQPWTSDRVRRVLTNPICIGDLTIRGTAAHHETLAFVPCKRFKLTQKQRAEFRYMGRHQGSREEAFDKILGYYTKALDAGVPFEPFGPTGRGPQLPSTSSTQYTNNFVPG